MWAVLESTEILCQLDGCASLSGIIDLTRYWSSEKMAENSPRLYRPAESLSYTQCNMLHQSVSAAPHPDNMRLEISTPIAK